MGRFSQCGKYFVVHPIKTKLEIIRVNLIQALPTASLSFRKRVTTFTNQCKRKESGKCHKCFSTDRRFQLRESSNSLCRRWHIHRTCPWRNIGTKTFQVEEKVLETSMDILKGVVFYKKGKIKLKRKFRAAKLEALNAR